MIVFSQWPPCTNTDLTQQATGIVKHGNKGFLSYSSLPQVACSCSLNVHQSSISNIPFILATIFIHILFLVLFNSSVGVNSFIHSFFPVALLASLSSRYLLHLCSQTKEHIFARPNQLDAPDKQNSLPDQQNAAAVTDDKLFYLFYSFIPWI